MGKMSTERPVSVRTIIVPLDGTAFAERALSPATEFARAFGAPLELLHVIDTEARGPHHPDEEYLARLATSIALDDVTFGVHRSTPEAALIERIGAVPDPLVCLATHAHTGAGAALFGNLAERLLGESSAPLVLVGPDVDPDHGSWPAAAQRHLVIAYDSSNGADAMVPAAVTCAQAFDWDVHLAMVLHRHGSFLGDHDATRPRQHAESLTERLIDSGVAASLDLLDGLEPGHAICELAEVLPAALVVVAGHREPSAVHGLLGSTATRIAHHAPCPVLVQQPR